MEGLLYLHVWFWLKKQYYQKKNVIDWRFKYPSGDHYLVQFGMDTEEFSYSWFRDKLASHSIL